jgi:hypothetical protein
MVPGAAQQAEQMKALMLTCKCLKYVLRFIVQVWGQG